MSLPKWRHGSNELLHLQPRSNGKRVQCSGQRGLSWTGKCKCRSCLPWQYHLHVYHVHVCHPHVLRTLRILVKGMRGFERADQHVLHRSLTCPLLMPPPCAGLASIGKRTAFGPPPSAAGRHRTRPALSCLVATKAREPGDIQCCSPPAADESDVGVQ